MSHLGDLLKIIAHHEPQLANEDADKQDSSDDLESEDLDVELDEADTSGPVEGLPRIEHADTSSATDNLGLDFTAEGTVEGDDSLVFFWEHGCLDTGQGDLGREDDGEDDEHSDESAHEHLADIASEVFRGNFTVMGGVLGIAVQAVHGEHESWDVESELLRGSPDGGWEEDFLGSLDAGVAADPALWARVAHHHVRPGHAEAAEDGVGNDGEEGLDGCGVGEAAEEIEEQSVGQVVYDSDLETAEARPWAGLSLQVSYCGTDLGGDGLALDEEELWLGGGCFLGRLLVCGQERSFAVVILGWLDGKCGSGGCLDGGEGGYD